MPTTSSYAKARSFQRRSRQPDRRGSLYLAVLGVAMIVSAIGMSAMVVARLNLRSVGGRQDRREARILADSALELGAAIVVQDANWRTNFQHDTKYPATPFSLGNGTITWRLIDDDGDLADDDADEVRLVGDATVGLSVYTKSVLLSPAGTGIDCLGTSLCVGNHVDFDGTTVTGNQFVSSNNSMWAASSNINVPAQAVNSVAGGTYNSGTQTGIAPRQMPDVNSVFDYYIANGTYIDYDSLDSDTGGTRQINRRVLSPASNPFGAGQTNAAGIYVIDCGGSRFRVQFSRIVGTLVLLNVGADSRLFNSVFLEPAIANYPSLLVQGNFRMDFNSDNPLDESAVARNFNPPGTPFESQEDSDQTDTYPCMTKGLVYVSGDLFTVSNGSLAFDGVLLIGNYFSCRDPIDLQYRSIYLDDPPPGFRSGSVMTISPGSWRRDVSD